MLSRVSGVIQVAPRVSKTVLYALQDINNEFELQVSAELSVLINEVRILINQFEQKQATTKNPGPLNLLIVLNLMPRGFALYDRIRQYFSSDRFARFRLMMDTIASNAKEVIAAEWELVRNQTSSIPQSLLTNIQTPLLFLNNSMLADL